MSPDPDTKTDDEIERTSKLTLPIDQIILQELTHGYRETPRNIEPRLADQYSRNYAGNRLRNLEHRGYAYSPGPAERSGMYQISSWGRIAIHRINKYVRDHDHRFHRLVERTCNTQPGEPSEWDHPHPDPEHKIIDDWIKLENTEARALLRLLDLNLSIPDQFKIELEPSVDRETAADILYALYFYGLVDRKSNMDAYTVSDTARDLLTDATDEQVNIVMDALTTGIKESELHDLYAQHSNS